MTDKVLLLDLVQERIHVPINGLDAGEVKMIKKIKTKERQEVLVRNTLLQQA